MCHHFVLTIACSAGVFWVGETLFVFVILLQPPFLVLWQWKICESRNSNPYGRCEGGRRKGGRGEKKYGVFSSLSPPPPRSLWLTSSPPLFGKFQPGAFASKLRAQRKSLHCRLFLPLFDVICNLLCTYHWTDARQHRIYLLKRPRHPNFQTRRLVSFQRFVYLVVNNKHRQFVTSVFGEFSPK